MTAVAVGLGLIAAVEGVALLFLVVHVRGLRAELEATRHEPPDAAPPVRPGRRSPAQRWVDSRRGDVLIEALLDEWTEACVAASETGWVLGIPTGETLLSAWARRVGEAPVPDPESAFALWMVGELGRASRQGVADRPGAQRRAVASREVFRAAGRLLKGLTEELTLETRAPAGVGPRHRSEWLIDPSLAAHIENPVQGDFVQPILVLRPLLRRGDVVLLEGEVA